MADFTAGPWFMIGTPGYLMMMQRADGRDRLVNPITIASHAHTEEIATVWNYLLPTEANARLIAAAPTLYKALQSAAEYYKMLESATGVKHPVLEEIRAALALADGETFRMRFKIEETVKKEGNDG